MKLKERWDNFLFKNRMHCDWLENESAGKTPEEIKKLEEVEEEYFFRTGKTLGKW